MNEPLSLGSPVSGQTITRETKAAMIVMKQNFFRDVPNFSRINFVGTEKPNFVPQKYFVASFCDQHKSKSRHHPIEEASLGNKLKNFAIVMSFYITLPVQPEFLQLHKICASGGSIARWLAFLPQDPAAPGLIPGIPHSCVKLRFSLS